MTVPRETEAARADRFPAYPRTLDCVHCGLCLPACPTHRATGRESDSPRGRIYLMRGWAEDRFPLSPEALRHLDLCISCRGCESACPAGIRMGEMAEVFRDSRRRRGRRGPGALLAALVLRHVIPHRRRIAALTDVLLFLERCGLRRAWRAVLRLAAPKLLAIEDLLPPMASRAERSVEADAAAAGGSFRPAGKPRVRVGLFLGCIAGEWYSAVHRAAIRVLLANGCEVVVPPAQTCCGAIHRHAGYLDDAVALFRRNAAAFGGGRADVIVSDAAGCGASLKEPPPGAPDLGVPVRDLCEFLDEIGIVPPARPFERRVAHHQACHLVHAQRVPAATVEGLLRKVPGLRLVPLADADQCCGAGGVYNLLHPRMSREVLRAKVDAVLRSGAEVVATANPGCWLQIRAGLAGHGIEVLHPVEILARSYPPVA